MCAPRDVERGELRKWRSGSILVAWDRLVCSRRSGLNRWPHATAGLRRQRTSGATPRTYHVPLQANPLPHWLRRCRIQHDLDVAFLAPIEARKRLWRVC
jgi:hypothetical protein